MKVAVFSDVHGNAVALEAVLADIERHGVAQMVYGGDLAFGGPTPEACVARIRALGIPCVRGNTDEWFTESRRAPDDPLSEWTRAHLTPSKRSYDRPRQWRLGKFAGSPPGNSTRSTIWGFP